MTACNYLFLLAIGIFIVGWTLRVQADETAGATTSSSDSTGSTPQAGTSPSAKTSTHKTSHHHRKKSTTATSTTSSPAGSQKTDSTTGVTGSTTTVPASGTGPVAPGNTATTSPATGTLVSKKKSSRRSHSRTGALAGKTSSSSPKSSAATPPDSSHPIAGGATIVIPPSAANAMTQSPLTIPATAPLVAPLNGHVTGGPEVETGLPVARQGSASYQPSTLPSPTIGNYLSREHIKSTLDNFTFTNFSHRIRNFYPWKIDIYTTKFWIGEAGSTVSSTTNVASAWDQDWRVNNGGSDTPDDREGFFPAHHAARVNPFYVALPFNDLAFPDKARRWLPAGWYQAPRDGKLVSACKNRWVEIKNAQGDTCYAQWEDVGPLRYDHAEYVFGDDHPGAFTNVGWDRAGLDVSPAVADYLNITGKNCLTRWRFVDDADVPPGMWLKYDEEALIFRAMHDLKEDPTHVLPIQRAITPIDDESDLDSNKKRLGSAKG